MSFRTHFAQSANDCKFITNELSRVFQWDLLSSISHVSDRLLSFIPATYHRNLHGVWNNTYVDLDQEFQHPSNRFKGDRQRPFSISKEISTVVLLGYFKGFWVSVSIPRFEKVSGTRTDTLALVGVPKDGAHPCHLLPMP